MDKLDFLLQSMVKMSRLETGTIRIQKQLTCISETLAAAIGAVVPRADSKQIQIHVDYDEKLILNHDKKWTSEALFNILDNAVSIPGKTEIFIFPCAKEDFLQKFVFEIPEGGLRRNGGYDFFTFLPRTGNP